MNPGTSELEAKERTLEIAKEIVPLINNALSRNEALQIIEDKYDIGYSMAEKYLYRAYKIIHDEVMENQDGVLGGIIKTYQNLYEKALELEDYREARQIIKDYHEALGLKKNKIEISGDLKGLFKGITELANDNEG
jgi:hypothetical protein